jgi:hypothetical protein
VAGSRRRAGHNQPMWIIAAIVVLAACAALALFTRRNARLPLAGSPADRTRRDDLAPDLPEFEAHFDAEGHPMDFQSDLRKPLNEQELL